MFERVQFVTVEQNKKKGGGEYKRFCWKTKDNFLLNFKTKPLQRTTHHVRAEICFIVKIRACVRVIQRCL